MSERKVIILGHVFDYKDKEPFVPSGVSVHGAIEYDESTDSLRCHECGGWFVSLARHISVHKMTTKQYRLDHGLRMHGTSLFGPNLKASFSRTAKERKVWEKRTNLQVLAAHRGANRKHPSSSAEKANAQGRCQAQLLFRIQELGFKLGHTPTYNQMREAGIATKEVADKFGSIGVAMGLCGLVPNRNGGYLPKDRIQKLPKKFVRGKFGKWSKPLPWPDDYFGVKPFERSST